jgi:hypothetical protein
VYHSVDKVQATFCSVVVIYHFRNFIRVIMESNMIMVLFGEAHISLVLGQ